MSFIMEAVADKLEVSVSESEVNGFVAQAAMYYGRRPEKLKDEMVREGRLDTLRDQLRDEKAVDKLLEMAEVVDAPVETESAKASKTSKKASKKTEDVEKNEENDDNSSTNVRKQVKRKPPTSDS
jgi:trigger factor